MKKYILAALAASVAATPAAAQNVWIGQTYGQDAIGLYDLNADVATFCKFGTRSSGQNLTNVVVTPGSPGSAAEGDGTFTFSIQNPSDNTVQAAFGRYKIDNAVCNTNHDLVLQSTNGGLRSSRTTSDNAFIQLVPYNVAILFDGNGAQTTSSAAQSGNAVSTVREARAGAFEVGVEIPARDALLLQGRYSDRLVATIRPFL